MRGEIGRAERIKKEIEAIREGLAEPEKPRYPERKTVRADRELPEEPKEFKFLSAKKEQHTAVVLIVLICALANVAPESNQKILIVRIVFSAIDVGGYFSVIVLSCVSITVRRWKRI